MAMLMMLCLVIMEQCSLNNNDSEYLENSGRHGHNFVETYGGDRRVARNFDKGGKEQPSFNISVFNTPCF